MGANEAFLQSLIERHGWLQPVLSEHLADNDEILSHVLMWDITRALVSSYLDPSADARRRVTAVLDDLDAAFGPPRETEEQGGLRGLIALSFLFNLPDPGEPGYGIRQLLGPNLASFPPERFW